MDEVRVTIIGAGVIGIAVAAELSGRYDTAVLEKNEKYGQETSSRNSEVIHSGIYYPPGSLKARLCVEGAELLYRYCEANSIPHLKTGKFIVASEAGEVKRLEALLATGEKNGVRGLSMLGRDEVRHLEPAVRAAAAIHLPDTGITSAHALMARLYASACASGAMFSFGSEAGLIEKTGGGFVIGVKGEDYRFRSKVVVNCAGLYADAVAGLAGIDADEAGYRQRFCKGSYFSYAGRSPVGRLVYPVPHEDLAGLGVHATLDLAGRLRFGPDTQYVDAPDYTVDPARAGEFYRSASRIIDGLDPAAFMPDMAGVRPKIAGEGVHDFVIREESSRGLAGLINLAGMESPGLTACLAIARHVGGMADSIL